MCIYILIYIYIYININLIDNFSVMHTSMWIIIMFAVTHAHLSPEPYVLHV
jgi:hypothetical protein